MLTTLSMIVLNCLYGMVGIAIMLLATYGGYKLLDRFVFSGYSTNEQIEKGNIAVAILSGSVVVAVCIGTAIVISSAMN